MEDIQAHVNSTRLHRVFGFSDRCTDVGRPRVNATILAARHGHRFTAPVPGIGSKFPLHSSWYEAAILSSMCSLALDWTALGAIGTWAATVLVGWYTRETQKLREISQKQLEASFAPVIKLSEEKGAVLASNIGTGPAFNVKVADLSDSKGQKFEYDTIPVIEPGKFGATYGSRTDIPTQQGVQAPFQAIIHAESVVICCESLSGTKMQFFFSPGRDFSGNFVFRFAGRRAVNKRSPFWFRKPGESKSA
jgi:hypothetical protein